MTEINKKLKFDMSELWLEYLASLGTSAAKSPNFTDFMDWCLSESTGNA